MTREEAIYELDRMKTWSKELSDEEIEAIVIALKALSSSENPNTCEDAISRQAAIDAFERFIHELGIEDEPYNYGEMALSVKNVPSVTPQQRTGRWIKQNYGWNWQCSECGFVTPPSAKEIFTFCPNCGAKAESEDKE